MNLGVEGVFEDMVMILTSIDSSRVVPTWRGEVHCTIRDRSCDAHSYSHMQKWTSRPILLAHPGLSPSRLYTERLSSRERVE